MEVSVREQAGLPVRQSPTVQATGVKAAKDAAFSVHSGLIACLHPVPTRNPQLAIACCLSYEVEQPSSQPLPWYTFLLGFTTMRNRAAGVKRVQGDWQGSPYPHSNGQPKSSQPISMLAAKLLPGQHTTLMF